MNFITGRRGKRVLIEMFQLVQSFTSSGWDGLNISDDCKFELSEAMIAGMADTYHRLVLIFIDPRWQVFGVCEDTVFNSAQVKHKFDPLLFRMQSWPRCKDVSFAWPWIQRLSDPDVQVRRKAHRCLTSLVPCLPVSAVRCEKKHLLGQETRAQKRRGKALSCKVLSKVTYSKSVFGSWKRARNRVISKHLVGDGVKRKFFQMVGSFRVGKSKRESRKRIGGRENFRTSNKKQKKVKKTSGY